MVAGEEEGEGKICAVEVVFVDGVAREEDGGGGDDGVAGDVGMGRTDSEFVVMSVLDIVADGTRGMIAVISSVPSLSKELLSRQWVGSEPQTQVTPPQNCTDCGAVRFHFCGSG